MSELVQNWPLSGDFTKDKPVTKDDAIPAIKAKPSKSAQEKALLCIQQADKIQAGLLNLRRMEAIGERGFDPDAKKIIESLEMEEYILRKTAQSTLIESKVRKENKFNHRPPSPRVSG